MKLSIVRGQSPYEIPRAAAIAGGALLLLGLLAAFVTVRTGTGPVVCPFRAVTGLPCATCGLTRCVGLVLTGHPSAALCLNPFDAIAILVASPAAAALWLLNRTRGICLRIETSRRERAAAWTALALIVAANWAYVLATHSA